MAAAKTWDVDRKKGGTFSFNLDAQGNYTLQKDGFESVKTLNLPELKKEATTTKDTKTASAQTKEAFGDVQPFYYQGGGADSNEQYINEYKIKKDKSLDTDIEPTGAWDRGRWGPRPDDTSGAWDQGQWGPQPSKDMPKDDTTGWEKVAESYTLAGQKDKDKLNKLYTDVSDAHLLPGVSKQDAESVKQQKDLNRFPGMVGPQKESTRFPGMVGPQKPSPYQDAIMRGERGVKYEKPGVPQKTTETALKAVKTTSNVLSKAFNTTFKTPAMMLIDAIAGSDPIQQGYNQRNQEAFSAAGYKTRGELGSNIDPGRIAGNPANNVFAGMNMVSMKGDVMQGARNRISTRKSAKTQARISKLSPERQKAFNDKTKEFERQTQEVQATKNKQDLAKGGVAPGASGGGGGSRGGGKSIICTQMYQQTQLNDWKKTMQLWYIFQKKYLTIEHQKGYHFLFKPFVSGMKKSKILTAIGKHCAIARTNDIKHIMFGTPFSLLGRLVRLVTEPICYITGKIKSWL